MDDLHSLPVARRDALRRIMKQRGVADADVDVEIVRYLKGLETIMVPSDAELRAMQEQGLLRASE